MKKLLFLILLSTFSLIGKSQQKQYDLDNRQYAIWSVKYSPLGLIEGDQALSIASEYRFTDRLSVQVEGSYIFNFFSLTQNRVILQNRGFRIVPEIRYYDDDVDRRTHRYMGLQLSYKNVKKKLEQWTNMDNYSKMTLVNLQKQNVTGAFIVGIQNTHRRIGFDLNVGIGIKYKIVDVQDDQNNNLVKEFANSQFGEMMTGIYPQTTATFKFCVRLF